MEYEMIFSARKSVAIEVRRDGSVVVRAPFGLKKSEAERLLAERAEWVDKAIKKQLERASSVKEYSDADIERLRMTAKEVLPEKVKYYSAVMGVAPAAVHITSAKTRYGSCSGKNSINFSLYLMDKDERAVDYVVVHELAHIRYHDHSRSFYRFIESVMPDYKEREALLK